jgi:hypothetical protein
MPSSPTAPRSTRETPTLVVARYLVIGSLSPVRPLPGAHHLMEGSLSPVYHPDF